MRIGTMEPLMDFARYIESLDFESQPHYDKLRSILYANINIGSNSNDIIKNVDNSESS